jgi:hypothetical protein
LVASSTLSVSVGVVGEAAVSVSTELVASASDCVVGWGECEGGFANVDWASEAGSGWTMSKPRELGGGSGLAMPDDVGRARSGTRGPVRLRSKKAGQKAKAWRKLRRAP